MLNSLSFTTLVQHPELINIPEVEKLIRFFNCLILLTKKLSNTTNLELSLSQNNILKNKDKLLHEYNLEFEKLSDTSKITTEKSDIMNLKIKQLILIDIIYLLKNISSQKKKYFVTHLLESSENLILENPISDYIEFYNQLEDIEIQLKLNKQFERKIFSDCNEEQISILFNLATTGLIYARELKKLSIILDDSIQFSFSNYTKLYIISDIIEKINVLKSFDIQSCNDD